MARSEHFHHGSHEHHGVVAVDKIQKAGDAPKHGHSLDTLVRSHYGKHAQAKVTKKNPDGTVEVMVTRPGAVRKIGSNANIVVATLVARQR